MSLRERSSSGGVKAAGKLKDADVDVAFPFSMSKLFDPHANWDRDTLGDVLHWLRQVIALICGIIWGIVPVTGVLWIVAFLALSSGLVYGYYSLILKVDGEEFGGHGALLQEGMFASVTLFLLAWTLVYSIIHF